MACDREIIDVTRDPKSDVRIPAGIRNMTSGDSIIFESI